MCNTMQMLYYQAPLSAFFVGCVIPFFEPVFADGGIFGTKWSLPAIVCTWVHCSCVNNLLFNVIYDLQM